jgi:hypothetical protein
VAEGEEGFDLARVMPAVSGEEPLAERRPPRPPGRKGQVAGGVGEAYGERLGEPAARLDPAEEHVGDGPATRFPGEPCLQDRGRPAGPRHRHRGAAADDHGDVRLDRQDGLDELVVGGRELEIGAVAALGLVTLGQAHEHDCQAGLPGEPACLRQQCVSRPVVRPVTGRVGQ